jgi:hypothetical protein
VCKMGSARSAVELGVYKIRRCEIGSGKSGCTRSAVRVRAVRDRQ